MCKRLSIIVLFALMVFVCSCQVGTIQMQDDDSIIYEGIKYYLIDEDFEYYVDYKEPEIGYVKSIIFPPNYLYTAKANDNLIYSVYGTGYAHYLFDHVWVKDGFTFPDNNTKLTHLYFTTQFNGERHYLEIDNQSFNDLFIVSSKPEAYKELTVDDFSCLCLLYEDEQLEQTITKGIRNIFEDDFGNFYISRMVDGEYVWYIFSDELTYQTHKCLSW